MYAWAVNRYTISGTCFGGGEIWTTSFFAGREAADSIAPTDNGVSLVADAWKTFFTNTTSSIASAYKTTEVKAVQLDTSGHTRLDTVKHFTYTTAPVGGVASSPMPAQVALVATLQSTLPRGLASKGRMFLPGVNIPVDATGHLPAGSMTSLLANFRTFINAVNSVQDLGGVVVLASRGRGALPVTPGPIKAVSTVKLGNVYDTLRRRRNQLVESYSAAAIP